MDIRSKRDPLAGSTITPAILSAENAAPTNGSVEQVSTVVEQVHTAVDEPTPEVAPTSLDVPSVPSTSAGSGTDDLETATPATEDPELSKTDPSPEPPVESSPDSSEPVVSAETEIEEKKAAAVEENPSPSTSTVKEITRPVPQLTKESPLLASPASLKGPLYQPDREPNPSHSNRGKGTIETIEELCQRSLDGINSLIHRSNERDTEKIRQLEADLAFSERQMDGLTSERDKLFTDCNDWNTAYETLQDQLKTSAPYQRIFSQSLPAWLSLEKLASLLNLPTEGGTEFGINPKIVWRILPAHINLVDELKSGTLAPRQLTSATDAFSEAVCALFDGDDRQVTNWHENANEYLKPAGYSFMILAVGTQIDNDLVTGSIQGKTTIGTIKRMPLIKDGGDVIRKGDVTGV